MKKNNLQLYFAATVLILIIGASILAPLLVTHNPFEPDMASRLQPPSWQHFFGTDALGRDMFSRILYGGRASILLSLTAALLSLGAGLLVGLFCGFYGGKLDIFFTIVSNIFQGIPGSCFMIAIAGIFGASIKSLVLALVITSWAGFSRIVRAEVLQLELLKPKFAVLDETDSGLDVDALRIVSEGVNRAKEANQFGILMVTHYTRILKYIKPDIVHVFADGHFVKTGGPELADELEENGYDQYLPEGADSESALA